MLDVLNRFPTEALFRLHADGYAHDTQMTERQRQLMHHILRTFSIVHVEERLLQHGCEILTWDEDGYPELLREIPDPPPVLYVQGRKQLLNREGLGIVGSRDMTSYGKEVAQRIAQEISPYFVVVSGLAAGVDAVAHETALRLGYPTVAVVATGLDIVYPSSNRDLAKKIVDNGLVVSEYPLGTPAVGYRFPQRNRIISGLSKGVLVCEAQLQSGAMVTAKHAMEQNRDVFAVPGPIFSRQSDGCHALIQDGAKLVRTAADVLGEYSYLPFPKTQKAPLVAVTPDVIQPAMLTEAERAVWRLLDKTPVQLDDLLEKLEISMSQVLPILAHFEVQGWVSVLPGAYYARA